MIDLNALRNNVNEQQKKPPTLQESITLLEQEVNNIQQRLHDFETMPPVVGEEERADGVSPESIIGLWEMRLELAQAKMEDLKAQMATRHTINP